MTYRCLPTYLLELESSSFELALLLRKGSAWEVGLVPPAANQRQQRERERRDERERESGGSFSWMSERSSSSCC